MDAYREKQLLDRIAALEARLAALESYGSNITWPYTSTGTGTIAPQPWHQSWTTATTTASNV